MSLILLPVIPSQAQNTSLSRLHCIILFAIQFAAIVLIGSQDIPVTNHSRTGDLWIYFQDSSRLLEGKTPYRDFALEYPPLALAAFTFPHLMLFGLKQTFYNYLWAFLVQSAVISTVTAWYVRRLAEKMRFGLSPDLSLVTYCGLVIVTSFYLPWRYDLFPALLTMLGFTALINRKPLNAGIWLGLGTAAKLYPIVLLPVFFLFCVTESRKRGGLKLVVGFGAALSLCLMPFAALSPTVLLSFLKYHQMRGLEIESIPAGLILMAHVWGLTSASVVVNYGADHIVSASAPAIIRCLPFAFAALFGIVSWKAWQRFRFENASGQIESSTLLTYTIAALLAFILANKVFSPQYLIWLLPFVPLLRPRPALSLIAVFTLTTAIFPYNFPQLCSLVPMAICLVNLRNGILLIIFSVLIFRLPLVERLRAFIGDKRESVHASH